RPSDHDHEPKARDVKANRDHVGRDGAVHPLLDLIEWCFEAAPRFRDFVGGNAGSKLDYLGEGLPILKQASRFADPLAGSISLDRILDLFLENPSRSSQLAQAIEIAEHGHVRVSGILLVLVATGIPISALGSTHEGKPN